MKFWLLLECFVRIIDSGGDVFLGHYLRIIVRVDDRRDSLLGLAGMFM